MRIERRIRMEKIYAFVDGVFLIVGAAMAWCKAEDHWLMLLEGLLGVLVGALTFLAPGITALGLLIYIAAWSLATGVLEIAGAIQLRKEIEGEWWLLLSGIASVLFAMLLMLFPAAGALGLLWAIGSYAIVFGALLVALGFKLFRLVGTVQQSAKAFA